MKYITTSDVENVSDNRIKFCFFSGKRQNWCQIKQQYYLHCKIYVQD